MSAEFITLTGMTPLFKGMIIKHGWFRKGRLKDKGDHEKIEREGLGELSPENI